MKIERRIHTGPLEVRASDDAAPSLVGMAAVYNRDSVDLGGFIERIAPGAFASVFADPEPEILALADHDHAKRLARRSTGTLRLSDTAEGLAVEIDLPDTTAGRDIAEEVRTGLVHGMSFGFVTDRDEWQDGEDGRPLRTLHAVRLHEVSVVGSPAYLDTKVARRCLEAVNTEGLRADQAAANAAWRARMTLRARLHAL